MATIDWSDRLRPLFEKYREKKHPLDYKNRYQLLVMVILSAQDSDRNINLLATALFKRFPSMDDLAAAKPEELYRFIRTVRNSTNKTKWLIELAKTVGSDKSIPKTMEKLIELPGVGRKSANVIIRESKGKAEGVIVDLHVLRVAPRIGLASGDKAEKIEKQLMEIIPQTHWNDAGMAFSFLGREICRPTNPKCGECVMIKHCEYYKNVIKKKPK
ncbi:MAG: endonuclease III domain-containing protein [Bacteroidota bacterium]